MKRLLIIILTLIPIVMNAQEGQSHRITFGAEWSCIGVFYSGYHYNFYDPEGFRVDTRDHGFKLSSNAEVYLHCGYNLNSKTNLSLYLGYSAIEHYHNIIPVSLRLTRFYGNDELKDRWFSFYDIGSGISIKAKPQEIITGKLGCGYRMVLSRSTSLDFIAAVRCAYTHPDIEYYGEHITDRSINRNNAYTSALSLGIALTF